MSRTSRDSSDRVALKTEEWKSRLIDLTRRNNLLYFRRTKRGSTRVVYPDAETVFNRLVLRKGRWEFWIPPDDLDEKGLPKPVPPDDPKRLPLKRDHIVCEALNRSELENTIKNLYRRSLSDYRERGVRILHAAFGMLTWNDLETFEEVGSPLILVPVEMSRRSARDPLTIILPAVEEEAVLNPALIVKLQRDFKFELPPLPEEWESHSLGEYLEVLADHVKTQGWRIERSVNIGLYSFHKLVIYKDLERNKDILAQHPIIRAISGEKDTGLVQQFLAEEKDIDTIEVPEKTFQILDADSSQRIAIDYAMRGQSFVMWGPPGTGKSQTIANMIAECIARGKSVLFVSDKMAALEVVYKRLGEAGLDPFCLELHSDKANKQKVVAELARSLDESLVPTRLPSPTDFEAMMQLRSKLNGYVNSLHQKRLPLGISAYEALDRLSTLEKIPLFPIKLSNARSLDPQRIRALEDMMVKLKSVWQVVEEPDFPWLGYKESDYTIQIRSDLLKSLETLSQALDLLRTESERYSSNVGIRKPVNIPEVDWLIKIGNRLNETPRPEPTWVTSSELGKLVSEGERLKQLHGWLRETKSYLERKYSSTFLSLDRRIMTDTRSAIAAASQLTKDGNSLSNGLLRNRGELQRLIATMLSSIETSNSLAETLRQSFDLSTEVLTLERVEQLSDLAFLCQSKDKPEGSWLDPARLREIQTVLPSIKSDYQQHDFIRRRLDSLYTGGLYDLDLRTMIRQYSGPYRSPLRWFRPSFHRDQSVIAQISRQGNVPKSILRDLIDAARLKELKARIETKAEETKNLLGHYFQGYATDFERVEKAVATASAIILKSGSSALPGKLVEWASLGKQVPLQVVSTAQALQDSISAWRGEVKRLSPLLPCTDKMPPSNKPIAQTPLNEIQQWGHALALSLKNLIQLTDKVVQKCSKEPENYSELLSDLEKGGQVQNAETELSEQRRILRERFGPRFKGEETNWDEILKIIAWTIELQQLFGQEAIPQPFINFLCTQDHDIPSNTELKGSFSHGLQLLGDLESHFEMGLIYHGSNLTEMTIQVIQERIGTLGSRVDDLQYWVDFKSLRNGFYSEGLGEFLNHLIDKRPQGSQLLDIGHKSIYLEWLNEVFNEDINLSEFRRENQEEMIAEFRRLDRELIRLSAYRVIQSANNRKPRDILIQAGDTEINLLRKESVKKRRIAPIRRLFQMIPNLLVRLKPCLLMSPLSVSQFLDAELMKFDLVLFDEASQIVPEDAVGAIYRGKTVVVAGDDKQLPPTSFFQKSMIDDYDWDTIGENEFYVYDSILEECLGIGLPVKMLRWHYRSKHEELISFSNASFYSNQLITFPSPYSEHANLGVKFVYVPDGIYDRGGRRDNPREAEMVADIVFEHLRPSPEKSLGVVTFSLAQMETVEEAIDSRRKKHPRYERFFKEDRLQGFFVKNLENVQGDERDIVIFSVGYGRDESGQMTLNFGPLNKPGGERRLNVAITRAREKVILVSSIKASDIDPNSTKAPGVLALRSYLEYAEKGPQVSGMAYPKREEAEASIEKTVADEIQKLGYTFLPRVGCSENRVDIGIVDPKAPGSFLLGVQLDGDTYRSSHSARDRDRLRQEVLEKLGWRTHQIWSPSWVMTKDSEMKKMKEAIEQSHETADQRRADMELTLEPRAPEVTRRRRPTRKEIKVQKVRFKQADKIGVPYQVCKLDRVRVSMESEFIDGRNRERQCSSIVKVVNEEGPVHFGCVVQRLAKAWGLRRVSEKVIDAVRGAVGTCEMRKQLEVKESFLWPIGMKDVSVRLPVRGIPESKREIEHIPMEEIEAAMKQIVQYSVSISLESLIKETAKMFGHPRPTRSSQDHILEVYRKMMLKRELVETNGKITVPPSAQ